MTPKATSNVTPTGRVWPTYRCSNCGASLHVLDNKCKGHGFKKGCGAVINWEGVK